MVWGLGFLKIKIPRPSFWQRKMIFSSSNPCRVLTQAFGGFRVYGLGRGVLGFRSPEDLQALTQTPHPEALNPKPEAQIPQIQNETSPKAYAHH